MYGLVRPNCLYISCGKFITTTVVKWSREPITYGISIDKDRFSFSFSFFLFRFKHQYGNQKHSKNHCISPSQWTSLHYTAEIPSLYTVGAKQPVLSFLEGKGLRTQQGMSVWVGSPKSPISHVESSFQ